MSEELSKESVAVLLIAGQIDHESSRLLSLRKKQREAIRMLREVDSEIMVCQRKIVQYKIDIERIIKQKTEPMTYGGRIYTAEDLL